jgi:hypothetical protein
VVLSSGELITVRGIDEQQEVSEESIEVTVALLD